MTSIAAEMKLADAAIVETDADRWSTLRGSPEAVVAPGTVEELQSVMAWASSNGVGVVPATSGRHLGPTTMSGRYVIVSSERFSGIETYDPADLTITAGAGTTCGTLADALAEHGQWLPFDPPAVTDRSVGGLVAAGSSGPLWMGYGELRNHVLGATVVTGDGRRLDLGGRVVKNVAGFDLLKPLVGSRGRLGVVTSVCLRAFPRPACERILRLAGMDVTDLVSAGLDVGTAPILPVSSVLTIERGGESDGAALTVTLHGAEATVEADTATLEEHVGRPFQVIARDAERIHATDGVATELVASVLPGRLAEALRLLGSEPLRFATIDTYGGAIHMGMADFDPEGVRRLRDAFERLGGALRVERAPAGIEMGGIGSGPRADEAPLVARVRAIFDPQEVLWRRA